MSEPTFDDLFMDWIPVEMRSGVAIKSIRPEYNRGRDDLAKLVLAKLDAILSENDDLRQVCLTQDLRDELRRRVGK